MKPSGVGGMAVIEGVMMKNKDEYAIAVRKPNNEIAVEKKKHKDFSEKVKLFRLPIFRGILAFVDSMVIGIKVMNFSASFFEEEEEPKNDKKEVSEKSNAILIALAVMASLGISIFLFMVLPVLISNLFVKWIESVFLLYLMEGLLRLLIFIGYILLVSQMKEIKRVFMYHGAEHKTINCLENGFELTLENVKWQSKAHKRCGTSFMLLVMLISLVVFIILRPETLALRILSRILLVPGIAGISYEFIRLAGKSESRIVDLLSKPGMWMQSLTTKEPDDDMIEVAIRSVDTIFDWRGFLQEDSQSSISGLKINSEVGVEDKPESEELKKGKNIQKAKRAQGDDQVQKTDKIQKIDKVKEAVEVQKTDKIKEAVEVKEVDKTLKTDTVKDTGKFKETDKADEDKSVQTTKKLAKPKKKEEAKKEYVATSEISIASPKSKYEEDDDILKALDKYLDFDDEN